MGITNFYKWIKTSYSNCILPIGNRCYNHIYIDLNYLLHMCYYNCDDLDVVIKKLSTIILDICAKTQPSDSINLYCDGTSPFAKLILQRERRFSSKDELSLNFTPGTKFINHIPDKLSNILEIIKIRYNITINIDTNTPGEAEIKIKNKLLENYNKDKTKTHILATNDADVILILTSHESYKKCSILLNDNVLSISNLIETHINKYNINSLYPHLDYSFLNLLMGNDYLPKLNLLTLDKLWESYKTNMIHSDEKYLLKIIDSHIVINKNLLIDILHTLICNMAFGKLKKDMEIYDDKIYDNYFNGLIWNLHMYREGLCTDYYYMCHAKKPINIINLLMYLYSNKIIDRLIYNKINKPIPSDLCCILLLPDSGKYLIDDKYDKFIDKIKLIIDIHNNKYKINKHDLTLIMEKFNEFLEC
jgi:5'-3' exonuclease